jgi:hypothetical protein
MESGQMPKVSMIEIIPDYEDADPRGYAHGAAAVISALRQRPLEPGRRVARARARQSLLGSRTARMVARRMFDNDGRLEWEIFVGPSGMPGICRAELRAISRKCGLEPYPPRRRLLAIRPRLEGLKLLASCSCFSASLRGEPSMPGSSHSPLTCVAGSPRVRVHCETQPYSCRANQSKNRGICRGSAPYGLGEAKRRRRPYRA